MVKNLSYTEEGLFREIRGRAEEEGISSREEWDVLVEQFLQEKLDVGEFDPDENLEELEDTLKKRYEEYEQTLRIK